MNYIVFDLEWNQSPAGKEGTVEHFPFEIIEIGAVKLDENLQQVGEFHQLIAPQVYRQLHYKILEVTHYTMPELRRNGLSFCQAAKAFLDWCGADARFVTWGSMDLTEFQRNMTYFGMEIPFPMPLLYYDLQKLYSLCYADGKIKLSLDQAVADRQIPVDDTRPFHHALEDSYYTGQVMAHMDFERVKCYVSMDYYRVPQKEGEEVYLKFPGYAKFVSREYAVKEEAFQDKLVTDMICKECGRMLRKKIRWFPVNQKLSMCLAVCPVHGPVRGKIRVKRAEDGNIFVVRTSKITDEEGARLVAERKEEVRLKRAEKSRNRRMSERS